MKHTRLLTALLTLLYATAGYAATVSELRPGHFIQIRGHQIDNQPFVPEKITLLQPDDEAALIGTIEQSEGEQLRILGTPLKLTSETEFRKLNRSNLVGERAKVEGSYDSTGIFSVTTLAARGPGRERLEGVITRITRTDQRLTLHLLGHAVALNADSDLALEDALAVRDFARTDIHADALLSNERDEDDQFGDGFKLTESLRLTARVEAETEWEDNLNFDDSDNEDLQDMALSVRGRLEWQPERDWFGVAELRYQARHRERQDRRRDEERNLELGEAYIGRYLDETTRILVGRQDFDDYREFIFDENLDAIRLSTAVGPVHIDTSVSKVFSADGSQEQEARNALLYVSNGDRDRRLAAYWLHRDYASEFDEQTYHLGVRAQGEWLPSASIWFELVRQGGDRRGQTVSAWATDIGSTWFLGDSDRWYATTGLAFASGDDPGTSKDELFRQTGLQDNNGKFGGVTSFRYYGEAADPELSNLLVSTIGIGHRISDAISIDLVTHQYRLHRQSGEDLEGNWDSDLSGRSRNLGWESDFVFGYRGRQRWEVEGVFGYIRPGSGFENADPGWLGKLQVKLRY